MNNGQNKKSSQSPQCARVQACLLSYLDGGGSAEERQSVQQHLDGCDLCGRELALYRRSEQALSSALQTAPPAGDMRAAFYARLASETAPRASWHSWQLRVNWRVAVPALAACSILVGWLSVPRQPQAPSGMVSVPHDNRIARVEPRGFAATAPSDVLRANRHAPPAFPSPSNKRIARNADKFSPVWGEARPGTGHVPLRVRARSKPSALKYAAALPVASRPDWAATFRRALVKTASTNFHASDAEGDSNALSEENASREKTASSDTFQLGLAYGGTSSYALAHSEAETTDGNSVFVESLKPGEDEGITIQVSDTRRGFTSSMRVASRVQQQDGQQVLTLHVEEKQEKDAFSSTETYALPGEVRMETPQAERE